MVAETGAAAVALLVGRVLFGGLLAFQGLNHFLNADDMTGFAEMKGVPAPRVSVLASGALLVLGGLGIVLGAYPVVAAGFVVLFFLGVTPTMHDFWAVDDPEEQQNQMIHFLKNAELLGAALVFLALGLTGEAWGYAVNTGLFL